MLAPGFYELTQDVENPFPDRRTKHVWSLASTWSKGTRFKVKTVPIPPYIQETLDTMDEPERKAALEKMQNIRILCKVNEKGTDLCYNEIGNDDPRYNAMVPYLVPVANNLGTILLSHRHTSLETIVCKLLEDGIIQIEQLNTTAELLRGMEDVDLDTLESKWLGRK